MKIINKLLLIILTTVIFFSCDDDNDSTNNVCEENYLTDTFATITGIDDVTEAKPFETHLLRIRIQSDGEICSIGYQSPSNYTGSYDIQITNNTGVGFIYNNVFSFSQAQLEYHDINPTLQVNAGDYISIFRTISSGYTNINQAKGRILKNSNNTNIIFPFTEQQVTFEQSSFYGGGTAENNSAIPYIGLGFKVN